MTSAHARLCLIATVALTAAAPARAEEVLDQVVAVVEGRVLTLSELTFEARVALIQQGGARAATAPLDRALLQASLAYAIGQRLQATEADKLQAFALEEGEVATAVQRFTDSIGGPRELEVFLQRNEADLAALTAVLSRKLRAEKILDSKVRLKAQVTDAEVRRYFDAHAGELAGSWESLKAPLREKLVREKYQRLATAELAQLRKGADVRVLPSFSEGAP